MNTQPPPPPAPSSEVDPGTQDTRPWYRKKRYIIAISVFAFMAVVGNLIPDDPGPSAVESLAFEDSGQEPDASQSTSTSEPEQASTTEAQAKTTNSETTTTTETPATTSEKTTTTTEAPTTTTTEDPALAALIEPGTYIVGSEIDPGVYRAERYWARLDEDLEIIDNDLVSDGLSLVVVQPSDFAIEFSGDAAPLWAIPSLDPVAAGFVDGVYLVGDDLAPGLYRVTGDTAYAARLDDKLDIIDNELGQNSVLMRVSATDFAFGYSGTLERAD